MNLRQAIKQKEQCTDEMVQEIIDEMVEDLENVMSPEDILDSYGLEQDYVMDLLNEVI